jgi:hypothetical protein
MNANDRRDTERREQSGLWEESNAARLVEAAMGGDARLDPRVKERVWLRMAAEMAKQPAPAQEQPAPFPDFAIGILVALLALAAAGTLVQYFGAPVSVAGSSWSALTRTLLLLNLAMVPVASTLIVVRRRSHV